MKTILTFLGLLCAAAAYSQNSIRPNLYFRGPMENYYNPAAGFNPDSAKGMITLYCKVHLTDDEIWKKPMVFVGNFIGRSSKNSFYTVGLTIDKYSFFNRTSLPIGFTKRIRVMKNGSLNFGGRAVLNFDRVQWDKVPQLDNTADASTKFVPDLDLGGQYQDKMLSFGLSIKNLIGTSSKFDGEPLLKNHREIILNGSLMFNFGNKFSIAPFVLLYQERATDADLGGFVSFNRKLNLTYILRVRQLRNLLSLEYRPSNWLRLGLSFDTSKLHRNQNLDVMLSAMR